MFVKLYSLPATPPQSGRSDSSPSNSPRCRRSETRNLPRSHTRLYRKKKLNIYVCQKREDTNVHLSLITPHLHSDTARSILVSPRSQVPLPPQQTTRHLPLGSSSLAIFQQRWRARMGISAAVATLTMLHSRVSSTCNFFCKTREVRFSCLCGARRLLGQTPPWQVRTLRPRTT